LVGSSEEEEEKLKLKLKKRVSKKLRAEKSGDPRTIDREREAISPAASDIMRHLLPRLDALRCYGFVVSGSMFFCFLKFGRPSFFGRPVQGFFSPTCFVRCPQKQPSRKRR
jgi:hypothetical protein